MESLIYGASPISEAVLDRARKVFTGTAFTQAYGMTELSPTTTISDRRGPRRPGAAPFGRARGPVCAGEDRR